MVSIAWKNLSPEEREHWDEMARADKERYETERILYDGPWKVPAQKPEKYPNAPKRPMSAFLAYSNTNRSKVKSKNPSLSNTEISRVLASMWKEMDEGKKQRYVDEEVQLRSEYKSRIAEWRANEENELEFERKRKEEMAIRTLESHNRQLIDERLYNPIRRDSMVKSSQFFTPQAPIIETMDNQNILPSHYYDNRTNFNNDNMHFLGACNGENNDMYFQRPYHERHQQHQLPFHPRMNVSFAGPAFEGGVTDSTFSLESSSTYNSSYNSPFYHGKSTNPYIFHSD
jgi:HMG (high mobility group) box